MLIKANHPYLNIYIVLYIHPDETYSGIIVRLNELTKVKFDPNYAACLVRMDILPPLHFQFFPSLKLMICLFFELMRLMTRITRAVGEKM